MVAFRTATENGQRLTARIREILEKRQAMHLGELRLRLEANPETVLSELEAMRAAGEIERLRPVNCQRDDHDYFRLNPSPGALKWDALRAAFNAKDIHVHARLAGETVACLTD